MATQQQSRSDRNLAAPLPLLCRHSGNRLGADTLRRMGWCEDLLVSSPGAAPVLSQAPAAAAGLRSIVPPLMTGRPLDALRTEIKPAPAADAAGARELDHIAAAQLDLIDTLITGEDRIAARLAEGATSPAVEFWLHYYAGMAALLFDRDGRAADHLEAARRIDRSVDLADRAPSDLDRANFCYFLALAYSRPTASGSIPPRGSAHMRSARDRFEASAKLDPANFRSKQLLLEAEAARLAGDMPRSQALYESAAAAADQAGLLHERAIAHECAGLAYREAGLPTPARGCFQAAVDSYRSWSAAGKAALLERRFPTFATARAGMPDAGPCSEPTETEAGCFAASIVHEINQPLAGIITHTDASMRWLDRAEPNVAEARAGLQNISDTAHRAAAIVGSLRALIQSKRVTLRAVPLDEIVDEAMRLTADELRSHRVQVATRLSTRIGVRADRVQLRQVVVNLISNAIHAMAETPPEERRLLIRTAPSPDGCALLSVEDRGCGMSESVRARIFEPLFTTKRTGMGVGLALCRSIVDAHGGSIDVRSAPGQGTTFELRLPLAEAGWQVRTADAGS